MPQRFKLVSPGNIVGAVILAAFLAFGAVMFAQMREAAHRSCLASIQAAVQIIVATNGVALTNLPSGGERLLSPQEVAAILRLSRSLDCARFRDSHQMPVDAWGHPFSVRVANTQWGFQATAFSVGRDGEPGTADDIH